jgi:hypothetical protein
VGGAHPPLSAAIRQVLDEALGVDPAGRPASARAFVADLERHL